MLLVPISHKYPPKNLKGYPIKGVILWYSKGAIVNTFGVNFADALYFNNQIKVPFKDQVRNFSHIFLALWQKFKEGVGGILEKCLYNLWHCNQITFFSDSSEFWYWTWTWLTWVCFDVFFSFLLLGDLGNEPLMT